MRPCHLQIRLPRLFWPTYHRGSTTKGGTISPGKNIRDRSARKTVQHVTHSPAAVEPPAKVINLVIPSGPPIGRPAESAPRQSAHQALGQTRMPLSQPLFQHSNASKINCHSRYTYAQDT